MVLCGTSWSLWYFVALRVTFSGTVLRAMSCGPLCSSEALFGVLRDCLLFFAALCYALWISLGHSLVRYGPLWYLFEALCGTLW